MRDAWPQGTLASTADLRVLECLRDVKDCKNCKTLLRCRLFEKGYGIQKRNSQILLNHDGKTLQKEISSRYLLFLKSFCYLSMTLQVSRRQRQPQPVGHTSCCRNHWSRCAVWPPWPHTRHALAEPRTPMLQMTQFSATSEHLRQRLSRTTCLQREHSLTSSTPLCFTSSAIETYFITW